MQQKTSHLELGILTQQRIYVLSQLMTTESCFFLIDNFDSSSKTQQNRVLLQLRGGYVIQIDTTNKNILCGFECDYEINFEVTRGQLSGNQKIGRPQNLQIIFKCKQNGEEMRRIKLIVQDQEKTQKFCRKLQKNYIVQLNFRQNFKAIKILGKGVTATVYKAIRFRDQKQVAIKSFKRQVYFKNANGKPSFQKQFKILSILHHHHICRLQGVYQTQNSTYIVMEHLELSLFGWIQKYGFPNFKQALQMMYHLLIAIEYLHSQGIMHRDLKLQNIMVRKDSRANIEIVVVDLGLAEFVSSQKYLYTRCGTPGYVAPQILQIKSGQTVRYNQSCDIFSLGIIFHILFFKKTVFEGKQVKQVIKNNCDCNINFDSEYLNEFSAQGIDLLKKMLEKDPSKRITASEALHHGFMKGTYKDNQTASQFSINNIVGVQSFNNQQK